MITIVKSDKEVSSEQLTFQQMLANDGVYQTPGFEDYYFIVNDGSLFRHLINIETVFVPVSYYDAGGWTVENYVRVSYDILNPENN